MKFASFTHGGRQGLGIVEGDGRLFGLTLGDEGFPGDLDDLVSRGGDALRQAGKVLAKGREFDLDEIVFSLPLARSRKCMCLGLNYVFHAAEANVDVPEFPPVFARFPSSLIAHGQDIIRPIDSDQLDYEAEMVAVVGKRGRRIDKADALSYIAGYSIFNDASIRDAQLRSSQWTLGKNYDGTGAFGPYFVTADALPAGGSGLRLTTKVNGEIMQDGNTADLICDVATLVSTLSAAMTLEPGDLIITGTPSGVGMARKPPFFMKPGDVCEVELEGVGILRNKIVDEAGR